MKAKRRGQDRKPKAPVLRPVDENGVQPRAPPAAAPAKTLRPGVSPTRVNPRRVEIPGAGETLLFGDPDDHTLANAYVGEETPGGTTPTPDQSIVDEIGRAYGLQEEDTGALRSASEVLSRRDRRRNELQPPRKPQP